MKQRFEANSHRRKSITTKDPAKEQNCHSNHKDISLPEAWPKTVQYKNNQQKYAKQNPQNIYLQYFDRGNKIRITRTKKKQITVCLSGPTSVPALPNSYKSKQEQFVALFAI